MVSLFNSNYQLSIIFSFKIGIFTCLNFLLNDEQTLNILPFNFIHYFVDVILFLYFRIKSLIYFQLDAWPGTVQSLDERVIKEFWQEN